MSRILSQPYSARIHISSISRNMSQEQNFVPTTETYKVTIAWYHSPCILYACDDTLMCADLVSLQTFFFSRFFCLWARVSEGSAQEPPWSVPIFFSLSLSPTPFCFVSNNIHLYEFKTKLRFCGPTSVKWNWIIKRLKSESAGCFSVILRKEFYSHDTFGLYHAKILIRCDMDRHANYTVQEWRMFCG